MREDKGNIDLIDDVDNKKSENNAEKDTEKNDEENVLASNTDVEEENVGDTDLQKEIIEDSNSESVSADEINVVEPTKEIIKSEEVEENASERNDFENKNKEVKTEILNKKKSHKNLIGISITFVIILLLFLLLSTVFALAASHSSTITKGVNIHGIDVSGLTYDQAFEKVSAYYNNKLSKELTLKHNEYELTIFPNQFNVSFDLKESVEKAYNKGRSRKYI